MVAQKRPTIKDVARLAEVSPTTVSHVLNDSRAVSEDLRLRVQAAARSLDYRPNAVARGLRLQTTATLGLILPDSANPFFAEVAQGAEETGFAHGYSVIIGNARGDLAVELVHIGALTSRQVDGLILISSTVRMEHVNELVGRGVAVVVVDRKMPGVPADTVISDHLGGAVLAVNHLLGLGHRRIGFIGGPPGLGPSEDRRQGYLTALERSGIAAQSRLIKIGDFQVESGERCAAELMDQSDPPTAIFAANDLMAIGALSALRQRSLAVPERVSVVGFDDIHLASLLFPPLTTVSQQKRRLGQVAVERLIRRIENNRGLPPEETRLPTHLVTRESTAPVALP